MAKETLQQKKARLNKSSRYKQTLANLKEIKEVKSLINERLNTLSGMINEVNREESIQLRKKRAIEVGDEITLEVKDVDAGGEEGELDEGNPFEEEGEEMGEEGGPDEVVEMEKEMKRIYSRIQALKRKRK